MAVVTGVMSSATPGLAMYNLIAAALTANPNWSRPVDPTLTGAADSYSATATSEVWKCTVGSNSFHAVFSTDTATPLNLRVTIAEKYGAADGCAAKRFRRIPGGGATAATSDSVAITPGATDVVTDADTALNSTSPYFMFHQHVMTGSAFSYLFKVTNKTVTLGTVISGVNKWIHIGAFESLVTGPSDPMPIGMFARGLVSGDSVNAGVTLSVSAHACGTVTRNPGLGTTAESGAFMAQLKPLHAFPDLGLGLITAIPPILSFGATPPRWYTKVLMSQAVIHQSRNANSTAGQYFRGYYTDLFAGLISGTTEPQGGGIDSVVIDGVTYYWLGANCPGASTTALTSGNSTLIAIRAD